MKSSNKSVLFTGGSGLLGTEMKKIEPAFDYPPSSALDVTDFKKLKSYLSARSYDTIIHAAALTSPPLVNKDPDQALLTNIIGTANVARACVALGIRLVYLSTDYVFDGTKGNYSEEDPVHPVNTYAWSKLGGECAVQLVDNSLIIRTTFGPKQFPYEKAFSDQWTSRESVDIIASRILKAALSEVRGVLHIGGTRKTVYQYARQLPMSKNKTIGKLSRSEVNFKTPKDTSLNTHKYKKLFT